MSSKALGIFLINKYKRIQFDSLKRLKGYFLK